MSLNFSFNNSVSTVNNRNEEACAKIQKAMEDGVRLVIKGYTNKDGYPYFWTEAITSNRTDQFPIPAYEEIAQLIINYVLQGKKSEIQFDEEKFEASKTGQNFAFELFKMIVEKGIRIYTVSAFQGAKDFNAHTNHKKGQIAFQFEKTEEFNKYLIEKNLI